MVTRYDPKLYQMTDAASIAMREYQDGGFVLHTDYAALEAERDGLKAARMAYASEFPLNAEGEPDVGNIHQNIRALRAENERLRVERDTLFNHANRMANAGEAEAWGAITLEEANAAFNEARIYVDMLAAREAVKAG